MVYPCIYMVMVYPCIYMVYPCIYMVYPCIFMVYPCIYMVMVYPCIYMTHLTYKPGHEKLWCPFCKCWPLISCIIKHRHSVRFGTKENYNKPFFLTTLPQPSYFHNYLILQTFQQSTPLLFFTKYLLIFSTTYPTLSSLLYTSLSSLLTTPLLFFTI